VTRITTPHWTEVWISIVRAAVWIAEGIVVIWAIAIVETSIVVIKAAHSFRLKKYIQINMECSTSVLSQTGMS
jgi:hypothetical protein